MNWIDIIGAVGSFLFAVACVPMAIATVRAGDAMVKDRSTIWIFVFATLLFGIYLIGKTGINIPSMTIVVEFICWKIVAWYSYFPNHERIAKLKIHSGIRTMMAHAKELDAQMCTRRGPHEGPCNGLERPSCRVRD